MLLRFAEMSRNNGKSPKVELRLGIPRTTRGGPSTMAAADDDDVSSGKTSPASSCVSSEGEEKQPSMVVVGCPRCLMYVMLSEKEPKCPKCKSSVLVDFQWDNNTSRS